MKRLLRHVNMRRKYIQCEIPSSSRPACGNEATLLKGMGQDYEIHDYTAS
jgi:hypothetical protein